MDPRSEQHLLQVHPDLARVVRGALQVPQPFEVVYGLRTLAAEKLALATGHSQTLHSRHLPNQAGLACAVDMAALVDGAVSFAPGHEAEVFGAIAAQLKASAAREAVPLQWGGDWRTFKDWGHFQLPWEIYP